jgi:beta-glucosidase
MRFRSIPLTLSIILLNLFAHTIHAAETSELFRDVTQPVDRRVADLLSRLTLEEKAMLLDHKGPTVERFNIRSDQWNQCLNGVKWDRPTTLFPVCVAMAATWDTHLVHEIAETLSDEARGIYNGWHLNPNAPGEHKGLIYRAPVINIERNPYWGRNHEAWGEDPFLTGRMAVAYVRGLQGDDLNHLKIAATLKHFAVNNVEAGRTGLNAQVSEAMLRDYWLPHFHDAVVEGHAQSLMASYNAINGTPNNINHWLLTDLLKDEWHHEGFVVSDLGGVRTMVSGHSKGKMTYVDAVAQSVMAGCDFSDKEYRENIPAAVREGKLSLARLDDAVTRVLRVRFRLGEFDPFKASPYADISPDVIDSAAHRAKALQAAQASIVLLQNERGLLPLDATKLKHLAVIGALANRVVLNNYNGKAGKVIPLVQGLQDRLGAKVEVSYEVGCDTVAGPHDLENIGKAAALAERADIAIVCVGTDQRVEQEGRDRKQLGLTGTQEALVKAVSAVNPKTVVVQMSAGPLTTPWLKDHIPAILQAWWSGEEGGHAIADVLLGNYNPAGRLPHTVYVNEAQVPSQDEYDISRGFTYMYLKGEPLYSFGHGLSYTTFAYSDLKVTGNPLTISATIKNTGSRAGDEVAQLYLVPPQGQSPHPHLMLRGFQRLHLAPSESQEVHFAVSDDRLSFWNSTAKQFEVAKGTWQLQVGPSSSKALLQNSFER